MRFFFTFLFVGFWSFAFAQSSFELGVFPAFNLNKKIAKDWKGNLKIESRQLLKKGVFGENAEFNYQYVLTDVALVVSRKVGLNNKIGFGYQIRFRDGMLTHSAIQQYTLVGKFPGFRLAHRIAADQAFSKDNPAQLRFRYRATLQVPLNGQSLDPKEFYLKLNNEYFNIVEDSEYDLEIRVVPLIGYIITDANKFEFGIDYRVSSFVNAASKSRLGLSLGWYLAI
ncbi:MAG: DUF2490 domain-containing protein [Bacteroidota bacterium]